MSDLVNSLRQALGYGRDIAQGASNAVASNVSGPVDALSWALRKAGLGGVIGPAPVGGSDWMAQQGLTAQPTNALAGGVGELLGMAGPMVAAAKAPQLANGLLRMQQNAAAPTNALAGQRGAIVWHGSPHQFDQFDMSKIGTGEGAQAYGHGLYYADNPATARTYATDRSYVGRTMAGVPDNTKFDAPWIAQQAVDTHGEDAANHLAAVLRANASKNPAQIAANKEVEDALALVKSGQVAPKGNLYKVDLPDEHIAKMLDWDKPLSQQSAEVQKAVTPVLDRMRSDAIRPAAGWGDLQGQAPTTDAMFQQLLKGDSAMSKELRARGIPGIKYLDGGSRGAGAGTRNYVVFDDSLPKILERK